MRSKRRPENRSAFRRLTRSQLPMGWRRTITVIGQASPPLLSGNSLSPATPAKERVKKSKTRWIRAVRPSRRPRRGLLRMRRVLNAIRRSPHAEERRSALLEARTPSIPANFFTRSKARATNPREEWRMTGPSLPLLEKSERRWNGSRPAPGRR